MRVPIIQPNYRSGGAGIAGDGPAGWVHYVGGALKHPGFTDLKFKDAMMDETTDGNLRALIARNQPDVVLATAITPMVYQAQTTLQIAKEARLDCVTILGGIHSTFLCMQVSHDLVASACGAPNDLRVNEKQVTVAETY